ncbi:MAG: flagellar biosynthetic protein FliR [Oscillospiraceae bacterium]|nr:flagellar biosynthetic protein FliR [Oscillospiraceae bacterium]
MQEIWDLVVYNFIACLIVFARVSGIFTFNPILGRANIPVRIRVSMAFVLTITMLMSMGGVIGYIPDDVFGFAFVIVKEAALGLVFGFMVNLIVTVIIFAGEMIDHKIGFMMAKQMDPLTGINMPVMANMNFYMFALYFFITGGHLSYIRLFALSYDMVPIDFEFTIAWLGLSYNIVMYFSEIMTLAVKMAMPVLAALLILELCVGVIMKAVPTIHIFAMNIQLKILMGLFILMAIAGPMSDYLDSLLSIMWENLFGALRLIG